MGQQLELKVCNKKLTAKQKKDQAAIQRKINKINLAIRKSSNEKIDLNLAFYKAGKFEEKEETRSWGRGKTKQVEAALIGRYFWNETFTDEANPKNKVVIERSQIVTKNGVFVDRMENPIEKYDITPKK